MGHQSNSLNDGTILSGDWPLTLEEHRRIGTREQSHERQRRLAQHKGQAHEVHGGRTAAKQQGQTDSSRGRGRAVPFGPIPQPPIPQPITVPSPVLPFYNRETSGGTSQFAKETLANRIGDADHPEVRAREIDPIRAKPLPRNHPAVVHEAKLDRLNLLMQPGSDDIIDRRISSGIGTGVTRDGKVINYDEGLVDDDPDDDWIS